MNALSTRIERRLPYTLIALLPLLPLQGCVNASVQEVRMGNTGITSGDSVVLLGRRQNVRYETEVDFVECVGKELANDQIHVIPEQTFADSVFPWFEPRVAPTDSKQLPKLLAQPVLKQKLQHDGVRYIVWIDGQTTDDRSGSFNCTIGPAGPACFGFVTNDKDSNYEAQVWDLHNLQTAGKISSEANGTDYIPMVVLPLPIIAPVFGTACTGLATNLRTFLTGTGAVGAGRASANPLGPEAPAHAPPPTATKAGTGDKAPG